MRPAPFLLLLLPAPSLQKISDGVAKLSSQDTEQYLTKFSFSPRVASLLNISFHVAEREYFGGEIQDRLGPAPARFDFTSAYTVEVSRFRENYGELQTKVMIEANKLSGKNRKECDVFVATILEDLERAKGPVRGASRSFVARRKPWWSISPMRSQRRSTAASPEISKI